eukprot:scpid35937/ scgid16860/ 
MKLYWIAGGVAILFVWSTTWINVSAQVSVPPLSFEPCGSTETFSSRNVTKNARYVSQVSRVAGNFELSSGNTIGLPVNGRDGNGPYLLFEAHQSHSTLLLPGATAGYRLGFLPRLHGMVSCTASFYYQLRGHSRLTVYQENNGVVVQLWSSNQDTPPGQWVHVRTKIPGNMFSAAQYFTEATMGYASNTTQPYVAFDDALWPNECCGRHNCSVFTYPCDQSGQDCVAQNQTCDGNRDCRNGEDEVGCDLVHVQQRPDSCSHPCTLTDLPETVLQAATVTRGPGWNFGNEDGGFYGSTGRVYNATYFRQTGWLSVQWTSGVILQYRMNAPVPPLCLSWSPSYPVPCPAGPGPNPGPPSSGSGGSSSSGSGSGDDSSGMNNPFDLCERPASFDNLPSSSVFSHLQSQDDHFDWDLTNSGQAHPGEPVTDVSRTGGYLIARSDAGAGVIRRLGSTASFVTPRLSGPRGGCTFVIHYYIEGNNRLNVFLLSNGHRIGPVIYSNSTSTRGKWERKSITLLTHLTSNLQIEFEAVMGDGGYVALDSVSFPWACCGLSRCAEFNQYSCQENITLDTAGRLLPSGQNETCIDTSLVCSGAHPERCPNGLDHFFCYPRGPGQLPSACPGNVNYSTCSLTQIVRQLQTRVPIHVTRGYHWMYGNEDGGSGGQGLIMNLNNLENSGYVQVYWMQTGLSGVYRFGARGRFDLCIHPMSSSPMTCNDFLPTTATQMPTAAPPHTDTPATGQPPQCPSPTDYNGWLNDLAEWRRLFTAWKQETSSSFCSRLTSPTPTAADPYGSPTAMPAMPAP